MGFSIKYKELFKIKILHQFFLNKGLDDYLSMNEDEQAKQLLQYQINNFFHIVPSLLTAQKLKGRRLVCRISGSEIAVWTKVSDSDEKKPFIALDDNLNLIFLLKIKDFNFLNYTSLKLENAAKLYYFSNKRLSSEPGTFPLINKTGDNNTIDEDFIVSATSQINELKSLSVNENTNLFGLVSIHMKGESASFDVTNSSGKIPVTPQTFELLFENRKTIWRYYFNSNQTVKGSDDVKKENENAKILISKTIQPLTQKGFVSLELGGVELPNPNADLIKPSSTDNKIYSEIYM